MNYDIVIAGGGLVGMASALLFADRIYDAPNTDQFEEKPKIAVLESRAIKAHQSSTSSVKTSVNSAKGLALIAPYSSHFDSRSTAISPSTRDIFKSLNLWASLEQHITVISEVHVSDKGHFGRVDFTRDDNAGEDLGYVIENSWLANNLADRVASHPNIDLIGSATVENIVHKKIGAELIATIQDSGKNGETKGVKSLHISAGLLVLADGAESNLAEKLGIHSKVHDYRQHALIANVRFAQAHKGIAFERFTENGPLALLPLGESDTSTKAALVWTHPQEKISASLKSNDDEFLNALQCAFGQRLGEFLQVGERVSYPLRLTQADEQVRRSLVLLGNAAHSLHPVAGQGFNLALRDALVLADQLRHMHRQGLSFGDLKGLQNYLCIREQDQAITVGASDMFNRIFTKTKPHWQLGRNLALFGLGALPILKNGFFEQMMGQSSRALVSVNDDY